MLRSDASTAGEIRKATRGIGADLVLDMVCANANLSLAAKLLRAEGRIAIIGLATGTLPVNFFALPYGTEVATSQWGTVTELIALARAGTIKVDVERFPLDQAPDVYARLRRGDPRPCRSRAVVVPA